MDKNLKKGNNDQELKQAQGKRAEDWKAKGDSKLAIRFPHGTPIVY